MKNVPILLLLMNILIFGSSADKALSLYKEGRFNEAAAIAYSLEEDGAKNFYVKAITEKAGNEAASLYRKALATEDITQDLSRDIYQRLAGYYDAIGIPGSVTVMLDRATMTVTKTNTKKTAALNDSSSAKNDTVKVEEKNIVSSKTSIKVDEDTVDFAEIEESVEKKVESKPVITKSVTVSSEPKVFYTLQTGAFGLESNALNMKNDLNRNFKNVTIIEQKSGDRTLHKVRVGRFKSQQEALSFAAAKLRPKKIKFRIVKE